MSGPSCRSLPVDPVWNRRKILEVNEKSYLPFNFFCHTALSATKLQQLRVKSDIVKNAKHSECGVWFRKELRLDLNLSES